MTVDLRPPTLAVLPTGLTSLELHDCQRFEVRLGRPPTAALTGELCRQAVLCEVMRPPTSQQALFPVNGERCVRLCSGQARIQLRSVGDCSELHCCHHHPTVTSEVSRMVI